MKDNFVGAGEVVAITLCVINTVIVVAFLVNIWLGGWLAARLRR